MIPVSKLANVGNAGGLELDDTEKDAILEIAYLTIAADGQLTSEEQIAFRALAARLRSEELPPSIAFRDMADGKRDVEGLLLASEAAALYSKFGARRTREEADERLIELARLLPRRETRHLAYKIAYALAMSDLATSDEEFEFDLQLIDALELSQDDAEDLAAQVMTILE